MPNTVHDVEALGYTVGIAHGDVQTEQDALDEAKTNAQPDVIAEQADTVTTRTLQAIDAEGKLPSDPAARSELATLIAESALDQITARADQHVDFHERALQIAKDTPNVWVVTGPGVTTLYVATTPDGTGWDPEQQAMLDALADPNAHKERCFQAFAPEDVVGTALEARALGADVVGDATVDTWSLTVDGAAVKTVDELEAIVELLRPTVKS